MCPCVRKHVASPRLPARYVSLNQELAYHNTTLDIADYGVVILRRLLRDNPVNGERGVWGVYGER